MCLAIAAKIISKDDNNQAMADFGGFERAIDLKVLPNVKPGEYVLVHAGFAMEVIDKADGEELQKLRAELGMDL